MVSSNREPRNFPSLVVAICSAILLVHLTSVAFAEPFYQTDTITSPEGYGKPHGSSIVELENGDLLASWYSTEDETSEDTWIFRSIWSRDTGIWGKPHIIVNKGYTKSLGNTSLFRDDDGIIWMFFAAVRLGGWSGAVTDYMQSRDEGKTWSTGKRLVGWPGNMPRNLTIRVGDHEALIPLFIDFWYEANLTGSYTVLIKYKDGRIVNQSYATLSSHHPIQPAIVKLPDGRILMLARDKAKKFVWRAYSTDNGKSWGTPSYTTLINPDSAISAVYVDEIGAVLVAYNPSKEGRNPLSLALSMDGGITFKKIADLARHEGTGKAAFAYPTLLRTSDGMIHAIWSHNNRETLKHARFNVEWLKQKIGE